MSLYYILHWSSIRESGRSREAIQSELKVFFLFNAGLGRYTRYSDSPFTKAAIVLATNSKPLEKGGGAEFKSKSRLKWGGLVTANERDSRFAVVHGCFSEGGDSILSTFSWEALRVKLQDN